MRGGIALEKRFRMFFFCGLALLAGLQGNLSAAGREYTVRRGDTLYSIAQSHNISVQELMRANALQDGNALSPGMVLDIPGAESGRNIRLSRAENRSVHRIEPGDTLYKIARQYGISLEELRELNGLADSSVLSIGSELRVPAPNPQKKGEGKRTNRLVAGEWRPLKGKIEGVRIVSENGAFVYSFCAGRVVWQGPYRDYGTIALVLHDDGSTYLYGGNLYFFVNNQQRIEAGEPIAQVASKRGNSEVYFSVFREGEYLEVDTLHC